MDPLGSILSENKSAIKKCYNDCETFAEEV
jgi:hypothetical protein